MAITIKKVSTKRELKKFIRFNYRMYKGNPYSVPDLYDELQPQPSDKHVLVEIEDACRIIRKAKPTIYTLVRKGLLPAYKKGKKLYFYEDELLSWIENGRRKSAEQTYEEMLANMQGGVRHKSKSSMKF